MTYDASMFLGWEDYCEFRFFDEHDPHSMYVFILDVDYSTPTCHRELPAEFLDLVDVAEHAGETVVWASESL